MTEGEVAESLAGIGRCHPHHPLAGKWATDDAAPRATAPTPRRALVPIFAVVSLLFTLSFWAASYLHDDVGIARRTAVSLVSALYAANLVGRLVASRLARRLDPATVLRSCLATALAGIPILLAAGNVASVRSPGRCSPARSHS